MTIEVTVNGKTETLLAGLSLEDLLQDLGMTKGRIAVELNGHIVPRSQFSSQRISNLDSIEIVQAIGGG
ncbi:MAG: thiamine biosynthesis protein ThiS [Gammaproteobacteria bacterium]|nr:thiamine biosynthesis protein ThiS [Gammaproteobacteria bacterium]MEC8356838.1 sulfur carrier protein ThiS [Pseudomonadota bacterium]